VRILKTWKSTIFWKIYLINLILILLLLGLMFFTTETSLPEISKDKYRHTTDQAVQRLKDQIENMIIEMHELTSLVQSIDDFQEDDPLAFEKGLREITMLSTLVDSGTVLTKKGEVAAFYPKDLEMLKDKNLGETNYFQEVMKTKKPYISDIISASTNRDIIVIASPIMNKRNEVERVVSLGLRIEDNRLLQSIINNTSLGDGYVYIVDQKGRLISHPLPERIGEDVSTNKVVEEVMKGESGYKRVVNTKGVLMYASYDTVSILNWGIVAQVPAAETYTAANVFRQSLWLYAVLIFIALSVFTGIYAYQIIKPIQRLYKAVDNVAKGDYTQHIAQVDKSELGKLTTRFNEMTTMIQQSRAQIQHDEEVMREQKNYLHQIINESPNYIYAVDWTGKFVLVNKAYANFYGKTPEELLYKTEEMLYERKAEWQEELQDNRRVIRTNKKRVFGERPLKDKNGTTRFVQLQKIPVHSIGEQMPHVLCIATDITERKVTEELLRKSDKLAVVGELAAGVAHEIRNPLTTVKGFLQYLKEDSNGNRSYFDVMLSELDRIEFIVGEFLVLSRPLAVKFEEKELIQILEEVITLIDSQAALKNVQIHTDFEETSILLHCEPIQLKQVFINILNNAVEAMPNGGNIHICGKRNEEGKVVIRFTDEGVGIPKERLATLGEPFYTTKEKGTGLGLMVSYKIIENHNGKIIFESEVGKGTSVEVML
jgi:two-component system, sporulation sensor kinase A